MPKAAKAEERAAAPDVATLLALLRSKDVELAARAEELAQTKSLLAAKDARLAQAEALLELYELTAPTGPTTSPRQVEDEEVADLTVAAAAGSCHIAGKTSWQTACPSPVFGGSAASPVDDDAELFSAGDLDLAGCLSD